MTSGIHDLRIVRQLERSIQLAPIKRATGLSMAEIEARIMRGRDERKRRHVQEIDTYAMRRHRNESGLCACGCGKDVLPFDAGIVPEGALFYRAGHNR